MTLRLRLRCSNCFQFLVLRESATCRRVLCNQELAVHIMASNMIMQEEDAGGQKHTKARGKNKEKRSRLHLNRDQNMHDMRVCVALFRSHFVPPSKYTEYLCRAIVPYVPVVNTDCNGP